jgi:hypothetical protein
MTGEHTRETLESLGFDQDAISMLIAEKVVEQSGGD